MQKHGFTLLELLISTAISTLIIILVYTSFRTFSEGFNRMEQLIEQINGTTRHCSCL